MGTWDRPVMFPYRPSFLEQFGPSILSALSQMGLQKLSQNWQTEQATKKQTAELLSSGWEDAGLLDSQESTVAVGKRRFKLAPIRVEPVLGPNQKPLGGQYRVSGGGAKPEFITIAQGFQGPITSIGEGDPSGLPQGSVYQIDSKTGKIYSLYSPKTEELKAPTTRKVMRGNKIIAEEWDKKTESWKEVGTAPRETEKPTKPLTTDQINKRLVDLEKAKLKIQTTKGIDPLTMFLMKDSPAAQAAYQAGDPGPAIAEIDRQLEHYRGLQDTKGLGLPSGLTEEDVTFNMNKYGKTREEVIAAYRKRQKK